MVVRLARRIGSDWIALEPEAAVARCATIVDRSGRRVTDDAFAQFVGEAQAKIYVLHPVVITLVKAADREEIRFAAQKRCGGDRRYQLHRPDGACSSDFDRKV